MKGIIGTAAGLQLTILSEQAHFAEDGALAACGADIPDLFRRAARYADRIIKGEDGGNCPIQLAIKLNLINLAVAGRLRLQVPPAWLALVDRIIE